MVSIVIRNKNEGDALKTTLQLLVHHYSEDITEIIVVDNNSTDKSIEIAESFGCKIVTIEEFTYGKAINLGITHANSSYVLLLSAHAIPIGASFFKSAIKLLDKDAKIAGIRFVNSLSNYKRAFENNYNVSNGLSHGLMAACAMINKKVWLKHKFDEFLPFSEDKAWSKQVIGEGYRIVDATETFFYFAKRKPEGDLKRFEIETIATHTLKKQPYASLTKIFGKFIYNLLLAIPLKVLNLYKQELKLLATKIKIKNRISF